jgi:hypothetical protein
MRGKRAELDRLNRLAELAEPMTGLRALHSWYRVTINPLRPLAVGARRVAMHPVAGPVLVSALLTAVYLAVEPRSADHAAQEFRTRLFEEQGLAAWSNLWFGGHHLLGYSVLFPPLAAWIGPRLVGAAAAAIAAGLFAAIVHRRWGKEAQLGAIWFGAATTISLFTGRLTFALGVAVALAAVYAAQRGWRAAALFLAMASALASPIAALFLACGGLAYALAERRIAGLGLAAVAFGTVVLLAFAFPEGGSEPFVVDSFRPALLVAALAFVAMPGNERLLRWGIVMYGLALVGAFAIETPMGGNATRMGALLIGPLLACRLWRSDRATLALIVVPLLWWQWSPVARDLERVVNVPAVHASYYQPLRAFLHRQTHGKPVRVEVLPTAYHWEANYVPRRLPIARGWERQLDRKYNALFYGERLSPAAYRRWLDQLAVRYVAVPHGPLDYAAELEAALIRRGLPYLRPVWRSHHWKVYRVLDPTPLVRGPARVTSMSQTGFALSTSRPTVALVRVRFTPYWALAEGVGCVEEAPGGFTRVRLAEPGRATVVTDFSPSRVFDRGPRCRQGA